MEAGFWMGLFGLLGVLVTAIATHLKNEQQDKQAMKRDFRITTLEAEHRRCEDERKALLLKLESQEGKKP